MLENEKEATGALDELSKRINSKADVPGGIKELQSFQEGFQKALSGINYKDTER